MVNPRFWSLVSLLGALTAAACGSSSTTSTAPATVPQCGVTLGSSDMSVPASGGSGRVMVSAARECTWTASSSSAWLTIRGAASGQGDGSVEFVAAANPDPSSRRGVIALNDQQAAVSQPGSDCSITLSDASANISQSGGSGSFQVRASSAQCSWTVSADQSWIAIRSGGSGTGNGTVNFDVAAFSGAPRTGTITAGGQRFSVTQSQGCTYSITPSTFSPDAGGGTTNVSVATGAGCPWTAASNVPWASVVQGASGSGPGTVQVAVEAAGGPNRAGTVLIAGQLLSINQGAGCSYAVQPLAHTFGASGGTGASTVTTGAGCAWSSSTNDSWITLNGPNPGNGSGTFTFSVAPVSGPGRTGTITIAGSDVTITQSSGCAFSISPQSQDVGAAGGDVTVNVTGTSGCSWTTGSNAPWITITSGNTGVGNGVVKLSVAATSGGARSGTASIAGQAFTVNQGSGCAISIAPTSASSPSGGGTGNVAVTAGGGCAWTAKSNDPWITVTSGASGSGNGTVNYSVASTNGTGRSGTITIGGQTFTVNQGSGCSFSISQPETNVGAGAANGSVNVTAADGCAWSAKSNDSWLTITGGANGSGNGTVNYSIAANTSGARTGTLTIAGATFTVNQASGACNFNVSPTTVSPNALGGNQNVTVQTAAACAWTATSNANWIDVTSPSDGKGSGNATVRLTIAPNLGGARSGTATIAGTQVTVNQAGVVPCTFSLSPASASPGKGGDSSHFDVNASGGPGCTWTATSNASWIHITSGASGTDDGTVNYTVDRNNGDARTGTITAAGRTFTVNQKS